MNANKMTPDEARRMVYDAIDLANVTHSTDVYQEALDVLINHIHDNAGVPVRVPSTMCASEANKRYGEAYGVDLEYVQ